MTDTHQKDNLDEQLIEAQEVKIEMEESQEVVETQQIPSESGDRGLTIQELMKRYHLKRDKIYKRMRYLAIGFNKFGQRAYLDREQIALMDGLDKYVQETGTCEGYLDRLNAPKSEEPRNGLSVVEPGKVEIKNSDADVKIRNYAESDVVNLALEAKSSAKRKVIVNNLAEKLLKNPNLMSEEDWEEINAVNQQFEQLLPTPEYTPEQFARLILSKL